MHKKLNFTLIFELKSDCTAHRTCSGRIAYAFVFTKHLLDVQKHSSTIEYKHRVFFKKDALFIIAAYA